jgi:hypothetical protein
MNKPITYARALAHPLFSTEYNDLDSVFESWQYMTSGQRVAYVLVTPFKIVVTLAMDLIVKVVSAALAPLFWINSWLHPLNECGWPTARGDLAIVVFGDMFANLAVDMWEMTFGGKPSPIERSHRPTLPAEDWLEPGHENSVSKTTTVDLVPIPPAIDDSDFDECQMKRLQRALSAIFPKISKDDDDHGHREKFPWGTDLSSRQEGQRERRSPASPERGH